MLHPSLCWLAKPRIRPLVGLPFGSSATPLQPFNSSYRSTNGPIPRPARQPLIGRLPLQTRGRRIMSHPKKSSVVIQPVHRSGSRSDCACTGPRPEADRNRDRVSRGPEIGGSRSSPGAASSGDTDLGGRACSDRGGVRPAPPRSGHGALSGHFARDPRTKRSDGGKRRLGGDSLPNDGQLQGAAVFPR